MSDQITNAQDGTQVAAPTVTPNAGGVATPATTTPQQSDAVTKLQAKYEQDINKLKSSLQRQQAQRERELQGQIEQARREAQAEIRKARLATMDEPTRKQAEVDMTVEEVQQLRQQNEQLQAQVQMRDTMQGWANWFQAQGVPAEKLDWSDPNALLSSGWEAQGEIMTNLRQENEQLKTGTKPVQPTSATPSKPTPPDVLTQTTQVPYVNKWADLEKRYGSREAVYRRVETGDLDASIIPIE